MEIGPPIQAAGAGIGEPALFDLIQRCVNGGEPWMGWKQRRPLFPLLALMEIRNLLVSIHENERAGGSGGPLDQNL